MKRRNFVKGILGLTGAAVSGATVAIEPVRPALRNLIAGKGISISGSPDIFINPIPLTSDGRVTFKRPKPYGGI